MKKVLLTIYLLLMSIFVFANNLKFEEKFNSSNTVIAKMPAGNFEGNPIYKPSEKEIIKALKATGKSIQDNMYQFPDFETVLEHIDEFKRNFVRQNPPVFRISNLWIKTLYITENQSHSISFGCTITDMNTGIGVEFDIDVSIITKIG